VAKTLLQLHEGVSPDHYDLAIKKNVFQKFWHWRRFNELSKITTPVNGKIVDIGCHSGLLTQKIVNWTGADKIYGLDISPKAIEKAKKRIKNGYFVVGDAQKLPFKNNFFEAAFCIEMIEHVDFPQKVLAQIYRVVKKNGYAVILIPTDNLLFKVIWFIWNLRYPVWKHVHVQSFNGTLLEDMAEGLGFKVSLVKTFSLGMLKLVKLKK